MTRFETHLRFASRFCSRTAGPRITAEELATTEEALFISFPQSYRDFALAHGAASAPALRTLLAEKKADFEDIASFLSAADCASLTEKYREAGMPDGLVAFARTSEGDIFCFEDEDLMDERPDDAPVWLYDQELGEEERVAESFDAWLASYVALR